MGVRSRDPRVQHLDLKALLAELRFQPGGVGLGFFYAPAEGHGLAKRDDTVGLRDLCLDGGAAEPLAVRAQEEAPGAEQGGLDRAELGAGRWRSVGAVWKDDLGVLQIGEQPGEAVDIGPWTRDHGGAREAAHPPAPHEAHTNHRAQHDERCDPADEEAPPVHSWVHSEHRVTKREGVEGG